MSRAPAVSASPGQRTFVSFTEIALPARLPHFRPTELSVPEIKRGATSVCRRTPGCVRPVISSLVMRAHTHTHRREDWLDVTLTHTLIHTHTHTGTHTYTNTKITPYVTFVDISNYNQAINENVFNYVVQIRIHVERVLLRFKVVHPFAFILL